MPTNIFNIFQTNIDHISIPERFTFPFYYDPHPLALSAVQGLQEYLLTQTDFNHNFGIGNNQGVGKMFGVLVVKNTKDQLGYISAFSGMMSGKTVIDGFAPPIHDILDPHGYFQFETKKLTVLTQEIKELEQNPQLLVNANKYKEIQLEYLDKLKAQKAKHKADKKNRKSERSKASTLSTEQQETLLSKHSRESMNAQFLLSSYGEYIEEKLQKLENKYLRLNKQLESIKRQRKTQSNALQNWLFDQYNFLNIEGDLKNVQDIFRHRIIDTPPSGTGDCAAPKLLQYAFANDLTPICIAEFWWGKSPSSEIRKHNQFYPACRGKCEPILGHMLKGMEVDPNPLLTNPAIGKTLDIVYEDECILVINKPAEFLSAPGKHITDSVQERMKAKYPESTGPLIVHRLDMSTSGLLVIGKTKEIYTELQQQFVKRTVQKRYVALLDGIVESDKGFVDLPLQLDINNRPYQKVEYEYGKSARTRYEVLERKNGQTRIYFYPVTGRTHQLRVHAAHTDGLNAAIIGDDLYGVKGERLHLHAESITFVHPVTSQEISLQVPAEF